MQTREIFSCINLFREDTKICTKMGYGFFRCNHISDNNYECLNLSVSKLCENVTITDVMCWEATENIVPCFARILRYQRKQKYVVINGLLTIYYL